MMLKLKNDKRINTKLKVETSTWHSAVKRKIVRGWVKEVIGFIMIPHPN